MHKTVFALIATLSFAAAAMASTRDSETVAYAGQPLQQVLRLTADKTHTEYETDYIETTCHTSERVRTGTVCRRTEDRQGDCETLPDGTSRCRRIPGTEECHDTYETVVHEYACTQAVTRSYEVFDYHVDATVKLAVAAAPAGASARESMKVELVGDTVTVSSRGAKALVLELTKLEQKRAMDGNTLKLEVEAAVKPHSLATVQAALRIGTLSFRNKVLAYDVGERGSLPISEKVKVVRNPLIGFSNLLREAAPEAPALSLAGARRSVNIEQFLGRALGDGRFDFGVNLAFTPAVSVINAAELPALSSGKKVTIRLR